MKPKSGVWKYGVVFACVIAMVVVLSLGCLQKESVPSTPTIDEDTGEIIIVPEEFTIYQGYIKTIGGKPRISDIGTIEATVISITKGEVCPDETNPFAPEPTECSIETYPKDSGIVRIDKIINYTPYSEQLVKPAIEQPSEGKSGESPEEGETTPGYESPEHPSEPKPSERKGYEPLQEGQEIQTVFLLTVRPAKVRYIPVNEPKGGMESAKLQEDGNQQTVNHQVEPEIKTFKPIPKDGNYFVFTTKIGNFSGIIEKNLPGLEVGSKFRAEIYYGGSLYVEEYEGIK